MFERLCKVHSVSQSSYSILFLGRDFAQQLQQKTISDLVNSLFKKLSTGSVTWVHLDLGSSCPIYDFYNILTTLALSKVPLREVQETIEKLAKLNHDFVPLLGSKHRPTWFEKSLASFAEISLFSGKFGS